MEFSGEIDIEQVLKADLERISRMLTDGSLEGLDEDSLLSTLPSPWPIEAAGSSISSKIPSSENDFHRGRTTMSAFDLAAKEGDQEEMSDRLQSLLSRSEEYDDKMSAMHLELQLAQEKCEEMSRENARLRSLLSVADGDVTGNDSLREKSASIERRMKSDFDEVEFHLAETRSRLARTSAALDDRSIAIEGLERELDIERGVRMHVEKERDAYMAAYEASLRHFEMWASRAKTNQPVINKERSIR